MSLVSYSIWWLIIPWIIYWFSSLIQYSLCCSWPLLMSWWWVLNKCSSWLAEFRPTVQSTIQIQWSPYFLPYFPAILSNSLMSLYIQFQSACLHVLSFNYFYDISAPYLFSLAYIDYSSPLLLGNTHTPVLLLRSGVIFCSECFLLSAGFHPPGYSDWG